MIITLAKCPHLSESSFPINFRTAIKHLLIVICCLILTSENLHADDYVLDPSPTQPSGNKGRVPFGDAEDPTVCRLYLQNLRYFAHQNIPMSCERPIGPHLRDRIQKVQWENLNPTDYPELFRSIVATERDWNREPPREEKEELAWYASAVHQRTHAFRRARLALRGSPEYVGTDRPPFTEQPLWLVQYGPNTADTHNPNSVWRCIPTRGGPPREVWSDLKLYLVSQDMKTLFHRVLVLENGGSGESVRVMNGRPYLETALTNGNIKLMQLNQNYPASVEPVCFYFFKRTER